MPYDERLVAPMREELTRIGFKEMRTAQEVDNVLGKEKGTILVVVNSVCGCAAGMARPGIALALHNKNLPDHLTTVFAGQDIEATAKARSYFGDIPPSSPSMALFQGGNIVWFLPRHQIEGRTADQVANNLVQAFEKFCAKVTVA
ncbi:BrxA/BrxB family bacilliredoxin [bacterium]|nr:BrxA/BrxB family bacilliredoxin [bacterium]